ncbi:MAG TPA: PQQ-binding-like beta-propeller repeat protein [Verrucomicrobiae bacterium]
MNISIPRQHRPPLDVGSWTFDVRCFPLFLLLFLFSLSLSAQDWPQILGPNRDGIYSGPALATSWSKEGPKVLWQKNVGSGFAGPSVRDGKLILFHRLANEEIIDCLNATNGTNIWQFKYPTAYTDNFGFDNGPRAVPTITSNTVVTFGADGILTALNFKDGTKLWQVNTRKEFGADKGFFGLACSPLVDGSTIIVNIGGENSAGIVAFELVTGKVKWKTNDNEASYSSPAIATINGQRLALVFHRAGLAALGPTDGKVVFDHPWRSRENASVNAATPLIIGNRIFISASYDTGASLFELTGDKPKAIWSNDDSMSNQYATSVHAKGYLYGLHGRHDFPGGTELRCVELATGKVMWTKPGLTPANVLLAGDQLLVLTERGELLSVAATPDEFKLLNRAQILGSNLRNYPALANGTLYARDTKKLVALDLR